MIIIKVNFFYNQMFYSSEKKKESTDRSYCDERLPIYYTFHFIIDFCSY